MKKRRQTLLEGTIKYLAENVQLAPEWDDTYQTLGYSAQWRDEAQVFIKNLADIAQSAQAAKNAKDDEKYQQYIADFKKALVDNFNLGMEIDAIGDRSVNRQGAYVRLGWQIGTAYNDFMRPQYTSVRGLRRLGDMGAKKNEIVSTISFYNESLADLHPNPSVIHNEETGEESHLTPRPQASYWRRLDNNEITLFADALERLSIAAKEALGELQQEIRNNPTAGMLRACEPLRLKAMKKLDQKDITLVFNLLEAIPLMGLAVDERLDMLLGLKNLQANDLSLLFPYMAQAHDAPG